MMHGQKIIKRLMFFWAKNQAQECF